MYGNLSKLADIVVNVRKLKCSRERDNKGFMSYKYC